MIIWINGAFGSGKTQTAFELHRRIPHSYVYDPENAGYFIRDNVPEEVSESDFQDYPIWREMNYTMLSYLNNHYDGILIVPMTIPNAQYFSEIVGRLRQDGIEVHHFTLRASKEVLLKRLRSRGEGKRSWAAQQIDRCIAGFSNEVFRQYIETDKMTVEDQAVLIASQLHIPLTPDTRGKTRKLYDRIRTQLRHIRF
ncbi:AAA family ATPase [Paenibacillus sp. FJAT-26967]|uniref:AAA family ATPase n=1 Tax=Paenibacillus sp. FJAT-26967 TaxID=1729690 RepID=UPI0008389F91|nr:AAA family ATPase [Paenibacillus sp. FJAT-26967]